MNSIPASPSNPVTTEDVLALHTENQELILRKLEDLDEKVETLIRMSLHTELMPDYNGYFETQGDATYYFAIYNWLRGRANTTLPKQVEKKVKPMPMTTERGEWS